MPALPADSALLAACKAALAWVDAIERDDGTEELDQLYRHWVALMRAAVTADGHDDGQPPPSIPPPRRGR